MLRTTLACLLLPVSLLAVGCADNEAAQRSQTHDRFADAVNLVAQADQGFVPVGADKQKLTHQRLEDYRQAKLKEAAEQLDPVLATGTPEQKLSARMLLSDIHASASRVALRQGMNEWAELATQSALLVNTLTAIDSANTRAQSLVIDDSPLLKKLNDEQVSSSRKLDEQKSEKTSLTQRIDDLKTRIADLSRKNEEGVAKAQELRQKAFPKTGDESYRLYDEASKIERDSFKLTIEAQELGLKLNVFESELKILDQQIASRERFLNSIVDQIKGVETRREERRKSFDEAEADRAKLTKSLEESVELLVKQFDTVVDARLNEALREASESVNLMRAASSESRGGKEIQVELLAKMMTKVHVLASHVMAVGDLGQAFQVIYARTKQQSTPILTERQEQFKIALERMSERQSVLIGQALAAIDSANELALKLTEGATETDPIATAANSHVSDLTSYRTRIGDMRLPGVPVGGTPYDETLSGSSGSYERTSTPTPAEDPATPATVAPPATPDSSTPDSTTPPSTPSPAAPSEPAGDASSAG